MNKAVMNCNAHQIKSKKYISESKQKRTHLFFAAC